MSVVVVVVVVVVIDADEGICFVEIAAAFVYLRCDIGVEIRSG